MNDWTPGTFLFWLLVAIVVPGIVIHFALGWQGGHRLFDKDGMSADEVRRLPLAMTKRRIGWQLRGSAGALARPRSRCTACRTQAHAGHWVWSGGGATRCRTVIPNWPRG